MERMLLYYLLGLMSLKSSDKSTFFKLLQIMEWWYLVEFWNCF